MLNMIEAKYFRIPEHPRDIERLWSLAAPIEILPSWLTAEIAHTYRIIELPKIIYDRAAYDSELIMLADLGFVLEPEAIYMKEPRREALWTIGIATGSSPFSLSPPRQVLSRESVSDVPASYVADPFLVREGNRWHMFFEVLNWKSYQGEIGWATSDDGLDWSYQRIVLVEPFHLSYPCVFAWQGEHYMVPETHQAGGIRLYRARRFPEEWVFERTLIAGPYFADSTPFECEGGWGIFADASANQEHDTLKLFFAESLHGPWREHPCSPIIRGDTANARPAGRVIRTDGKLVRFAQNCQPHYGTEVRAFAIEEITATTYRERPLGVVLGPSRSGWNADGMHHIDAQQLPDATWLAAVDGWQLPPQ